MASANDDAVRDVVVLDGVSRRYADFEALAPLDLSLRPGRVLGLLGPNGAGKTTLLSIMAAQLAPTTGTLSVDGRIIRNDADARDARRGLALMPQELATIPGFTAQDVVEYSAWLKGVPAGQRRERARAALDEVGLADRRRMKVSRLSGGMVRRVHLAAALVSEPHLLLLDEPTAGLDPAQRIAFRQLIEARGACATVMSTHLVEDVRAMSDEVLVLVGGRVVFRGTVGALEAMARPGAPGDSDLERGYMTLLSGTAMDAGTGYGDVSKNGHERHHE